MAAAAGDPASAQPAASPWAIPAEGDCAAASPSLPEALQPGRRVVFSDIAALEGFLPPEVWARRERFFPDGMQMEVGPCYRDYSPPAFHTEATERFQGKARLSSDGDLERFPAGLPFPPVEIAPDDSNAALKWVWNGVYRHAGAGRRGSVRLTWIEPDGAEVRIEGESFTVHVQGRADRPQDDYKLPQGRDNWLVNGGWSVNPVNGSWCRWMLYQTLGRGGDLFGVVPGARRAVRVHVPDLEGALFTCQAGPRSTLLLHGGMPHRHEWSLLGLRDVMAPINSRAPLYPQDPNRNFGPSGLSFASDRWELRRAIVIQGKRSRGEFEDHVDRYVWYVDLQTLFPLYYVAHRDDPGEDPDGGIGQFVGRWSEDRSDYPAWPDDPKRPVRIVDLIGAAMADWSQKSMVRLETGDNVGTPPPDAELKRMLSQSQMERAGRPMLPDSP